MGSWPLCPNPHSAIQNPKSPIQNRDDARLYRDFVTYGFTRWERHLRSAFKHVFAYKQWKRLARDLNFSLDATPKQLTFDQWLGLYHAFQHLAAGRNTTGRECVEREMS